MPNDDPTLDLGLPTTIPGEPDFPWPIATDATPEPSSSYGIVAAQNWPNLTPAERGAALFVGDGLAGPGNVRPLAKALGITPEETLDLLWGLLRKGYLQAVAGWWSR